MIKPRFYIYRSPKLNKFIRFLFFLTLFLLPYDGIKLLPSNYKPICLIPAALLFFILIPKILDKGFTKPIIALAFFVLLSLVNTIIIDFAINDFSNFLDFLLTIFLLFFSFTSMSYLFIELKETYGKEETIHFFFKVVAFAYVLPTFVVLVDTLVIFHVLPYGIKNVIRTVFGGNQPDRITGTSFECSWLSYHLLLSSAAYLFVYKHENKKRYLFLLLICLAAFGLSFSLQGYIVFAVFCVIYFFKNIKKIRFPYVIAAVSLILLVVIAFLVVLKLYKDDYYFISRLRSFVDVETLFRTDLSTFVRAGYPILGMRMFFDHPLLGVGGSNFGLYLGDYVNRYYPWAPYFYGSTQNEVFMTIANKSGNPKMLFVRILCELGIVPFILFIVFLHFILKRARKEEYIESLLYLAICFTLQFDSFCFALLILPLSFASCLPEKRYYTAVVKDIEPTSKTHSVSEAV